MWDGHSRPWKRSERLWSNQGSLLESEIKVRDRDDNDEILKVTMWIILNMYYMIICIILKSNPSPIFPRRSQRPPASPQCRSPLRQALLKAVALTGALIFYGQLHRSSQKLSEFVCESELDQRGWMSHMRSELQHHGDMVLARSICTTTWLMSHLHVEVASSLALSI